MSQPPIKEQLKKLREEGSQLNPDRVWVLENRERLESRITVTRRQSGKLNLFEAFHIFIPARFSVVARPVFTTFLVVVMSAAGWTASVGASYNSLPGDTLYSVKIATEKTQVAVAGFTGGPEKKAEALNNVAKTRAYEAKELVSQKKLDQVDKTLSSLQKTVDKASESLQDVKQTAPEKATAVANNITETAEAISQTLDEAMNQVDNSELIGKISDAKQKVTGKGIEAVGLVVDLAKEQKENGELGGIAKEKVEELMKKTIDNLSNHAEKAAAATKEMELILEDSRQNVVGATTTISSTTISSVSVSATSSLTVTVSEDSGDNGGPAASVKATTNETVREDLEAVRKLVKEGQMSEAIEKAKEINNGASALAKDAKQTVVEERNKQAEGGNGGSAVGETAIGGASINVEAAATTQTTTLQIIIQN